MQRNNPNITIEFKAKGHKPLIDALQKLNAEQKKLAGAVKNTGSAVKSFNMRVDRATDTANRNRTAMNRLKASIAVYRNTILLGAFATGLFAKTIGKLMSAYGDQELAERKLESALGRRSQALLDFASTQQQATSFGDELTISAMSQAASFTKNEDAIAQMAQAAIDFSAKTGKTMDESMRMITSSVFGTRNAFKTFGIEMTNAKNPTQRLYTLMQSLGNYSGGEAVNQMGTYASQVRAFQGAVGDLAETFGKDFLDIVTGIITLLSEVARGINGLSMGFLNAAGIAMSLGASIYYAYRQFITLNTTIASTKTGMDAAAVSSARLAGAIKILRNTTIAFIAIAVAFEAISYIFGRTASSASDASRETKRIVLDLADMRHELSRMNQDALKLALTSSISKASDAMLKLQLHSQKFSDEFKGDWIFKKLDINNTTLLFSSLGDTFKDVYQEAERLGGAPLQNLSKVLNEMEIGDLTKMEEEMRGAFQAGDSKEANAAGQQLILMINRLIQIKTLLRDMKFATTDWLDDLPAKLENTNDKLKAQNKHFGDEVALQMELLRIEAERKGINTEANDVWNQNLLMYEYEIELAIKLKQQLKQVNSERSSTIQQTNQLASAMANVIITTDIAALTWDKFGAAVVDALNRILAKFLSEYIVFQLLNALMPGVGMTAPSLFGFSPQAPTTWSGVPFAPGYHSGGMIPQSYHSGGDVPIIAQEGEFVMRRSAVQSIGVENLNRMNRTGQAGGVNVTFSGNVMSDDFVEDVAIPKIKDAIRRGADIGIS